tara:strand:- start:1429 stop:1539 length:111 start_codon:yes stop_codon:yes gene_type:complete
MQDFYFFHQSYLDKKDKKDKKDKIDKILVENPFFFL